MVRVESLPPDLPVPLAQGGNFLHWREKLEGTATVVESTEDGCPAIMSSGAINYLAGWPDDEALARILLDACEKIGLETDILPEGLRRRDTPTHRFWFNYNPVDMEWGGTTIPAAGVYWEPHFKPDTAAPPQSPPAVGEGRGGRAIRSTQKRKPIRPQRQPICPHLRRLRRPRQRRPLPQPATVSADRLNTQVSPSPRSNIKTGSATSKNRVRPRINASDPRRNASISR